MLYFFLYGLNISSDSVFIAPINFWALLDRGNRSARRFYPQIIKKDITVFLKTKKVRGDQSSKRNGRKFSRSLHQKNCRPVQKKVQHSIAKSPSKKRQNYIKISRKIMKKNEFSTIKTIRKRHFREIRSPANVLIYHETWSPSLSLKKKTL